MLYTTMASVIIIHAAAIRIGFEKEINNFTEPRFEEEVFIYVTKENNVISEQTFRIAFQRTNSVPQGSGFGIAQDGQDYRGLPVVIQQTFFPFQQRFTLNFILLSDNNLEATEAFQIRLSTQDYPLFYRADMLFSQTFVVIDDDDSS